MCGCPYWPAVLEVVKGKGKAPRLSHRGSEGGTSYLTSAERLRIREGERWMGKGNMSRIL